ncbi:arsenate reductase family protein [Marispirochaeta sp.]|jgi:arsenate reductase (glutaredoxin)|uniref:arsenate reductase family protein n=1 Tax=Marispirochaeta sp. TaxID=2038653 RepID=UPI0029C973E6|nr:arsenate reductase family protein [Marispirochaeta sp.]
MTIQIFGTKKCKDTQKAVRFFKERGINPHQVDLKEKGISPGELSNVARAVGREKLIDPESKAYKEKGMAYMDFDPEEEVLENPLLLKTPVVRNGKEATIGHDPETWQAWIEKER